MTDWNKNLIAATYGTPWGSGRLDPKDCPTESLLCHMVRYYLGADSTLLRTKIAGSASHPAERIEYAQGRNPFDFRTTPRIMVYLTNIPETAQPTRSNLRMVGVEVALRYELTGMPPLEYGKIGIDGVLFEIRRVLRKRRTLPVTVAWDDDDPMRELAENSNFVGLDYYGPDRDDKTGRVLVTHAVRWVYECLEDDETGVLVALLH